MDIKVFTISDNLSAVNIVRALSVYVQHVL